MKNVVNLDEVAFTEGRHGESFAWKTAPLGEKLGAKDLGYCIDVIPPGKRAAPFHSHRGQEEMFLILSGSGTLRYGGERRKLRAGDVICCPTGGPETAHQVINDSTEELRMLSVSTKVYPDVCEYPDSGKVMSFGPGYRHSTRASDHIDYWTDEN